MMMPECCSSDTLAVLLHRTNFCLLCFHRARLFAHSCVSLGVLRRERAGSECRNVDAGFLQRIGVVFACMLVWRLSFGDTKETVCWPHGMMHLMVRRYAACFPRICLHVSSIFSEMLGSALFAA